MIGVYFISLAWKSATLTFSATRLIKTLPLVLHILACKMDVTEIVVKTALLCVKENFHFIRCGSSL